MQLNEIPSSIDQKLCLQGILHYKKGDFADAARYSSQSINIKPGYLAYRYLGFSLIHLKKPHEAISALLESNSIKEHPQCYRGLADCYFDLNQLELAEQALAASIRLDPRPDTYRSLGILYVKVKKYKQAIEALMISTESIKDWYSYQALGEAYLNRKQARSAIDAFNQSITYSVQDKSQTFFGLAVCYEMLGDSANCVENYYKTAKLLLTAKHIGIYIRKIKKYFPHPIANKMLLDANMAELAKDVTCSLNNNALEYKVLRCISLAQEFNNSITMSHQTYLEESLDLILSATKAQFDVHDTIVFGVSHAQIFEGIPGVRVHAYPGATMFSLGKKNSRTGAYQKIIKVIEDRKVKANIVLEFGEVDLRRHAMKISMRENLSPNEVIDSAISKYFEFIDQLNQDQINIIVSGPHSGGASIVSSYSDVERNMLCWYMNSRLASQCASRNIPFITLFDLAVNLKTLQSRKNLYYDQLHLHTPPHSIGVKIQGLLHSRLHEAINYSKSVQLPKIPTRVDQACKIIASDLAEPWNGSTFLPGSILPKAIRLEGSSANTLVIELPYSTNIKSVKITTIGGSVASEVHLLKENFSPSTTAEAPILLKSSKVQSSDMETHNHTDEGPISIAPGLSRFIIIHFKGHKRGSTFVQSLSFNKSN